MITIYAEKPDMGTKIAAALDCITLHDGTKVSFSELGKYEKAIKAQRAKDGYFMINYDHKTTAVTWGYGHLCTLKQAKDYQPEYEQWSKLPLPYIPENYELKLNDGVEKQYRIIKELFKKSEYIISATDDDREGDLIFAYLYEYMKCIVPFKRALFNQQSQEEFKKAFATNSLVDGRKRQPVIDAGKARSAGDFIVGAGPTVAMTLKYPGNSTLSVGRVQTAVLNLVVEREREIRNFIPKDYYVIKGLFTKQSDDSYIGTHTKRRFEKKEEAEALINRLLDTYRTATVTSVKKKQSKRSKPLLYSLSTLQMEANKKYGLTLKETLEIAQKLYESGYTTYPRTDSNHLPEDMYPEMKLVLQNLFKNPDYTALNNGVALTKQKHYFDTSKVSSHFAIVPTKKAGNGLTGNEKRIYDLIARSVICMVYPEALMNKTEIITEIKGEAFSTTGTSIQDPGFFQVIGMPKETLLPLVAEGEQVSSKFAMESKKTEPPKRYTDATLVNAMINCGKTLEDEELRALMEKGPDGKPRGLGRPSSQATIVTTLTDRGYVERKGKTIYSTEKGMLLIQCFPVADLKSATITAQWEKRLDDIEHGVDSYKSFMRDLEEKVRVWTKEIMESKTVTEFLNSGNATGKETIYRCPKCNSPLIHCGKFYVCMNRDTGCDFILWKTVAGKELPQKQIANLLERGYTDYIDGFKGKKKFGCKLRFDANKKITFDFEDKTTELKCPLCGKPLEKAPFGYVCSGHKSNECDFIIGKIASKALSDTEIKQLLAGKIITVKGMKSSKGKPFSAKVQLQTEGEERGRLCFVN